MSVRNRKWFKIILKVCVSALAAMFGFTCIALFSAPRGHVASETWLLSTFSVGRQIDWKLFGEMERKGPDRNVLESSSNNAVHIEDKHFLKRIPHSFQVKLLTGLQLNCHPAGEIVLLKKYERFLKTLIDYGAYHSLFGKSPTPRLLVWACTAYDYCGGLGDRVKGAVYALMLAMFSRRKLILFWDGSPEGAYLDPHLINWKDEKIYDALKGLNNNNIPFPAYFSNPYLFKFHAVEEFGSIINDISQNDMEYFQRVIGSSETNVIISTNLDPSSLLDDQRNGNQEWIRAGLEWTGLSHLTPNDIDDLVGVVFRYLFKIKEEVFHEVQAAGEVLGLHRFPYIALHIRSGFAGMEHYEELVRHPKLQHDISEWQSALKCAIATADRLLGNDSRVFLATDTNLVKHMAVSKYGDRIFTLANSLVHIDKLEKKPHSLRYDEKEGIFTIWVELILLAEARILIRGLSGYSWLAGLLCGLNINRTILLDDCSHT